MNAVRCLLMLLVVWSADSVLAETRFVAVDVYIESVAPLAAWQFEFSDQRSVTRIVGIENGDAEVFHAAPFYDRDVVATGKSDRVVVADYSLAERTELPSGRIRVATLHLVVSDAANPEFASSLIVAATHGGKNIEAEISVEISAGREQ